MSQHQRRIKHGNLRSIHNLCPHCLSRLQTNKEGEIVCTGDRLELWKKEAKKFKKMDLEQKKAFLETLDSPHKFLDMVNIETGEVYCGYNTRMISIMNDGVQLIPDPIVVGKIERKLKRNLTEAELEEGYIFNIEGEIYTIPFIRFPDDV